MAIEEIFLEGEDRMRRLFGEVHFLLMRRMRYGIGNCTHCEDADVLSAQMEVMDWQLQKKKDDAEGEVGS